MVSFSFDILSIFVFLNAVKEIHHSYFLGAVRCDQRSVVECLSDSECEIIPTFVKRYGDTVRYGDTIWCNNNCVIGNDSTCFAKCECVKKGNLVMQIVISVLNFDFDSMILFLCFLR